MDTEAHPTSTARRFRDALKGSDAARAIAAAVVAPVIVALTVPDLWWIPTAVIVGLSALGEIILARWASRGLAGIEHAGSVEQRRFASRLLIAGGCIVTLCAIESFILAFAPMPGPIIGYVFAMGAIVRLVVQKASPRTMMKLSSPLLGIAMAANAMAIGGWIGITLTIVGTIILTYANSRISIIAVSELITRRTEAEALALVLEQRVEERTAELRAAMLEAENANNTKSIFLANMSHELRTPLNAIIGYAELIEESNPTGETAEDLRRIQGSARHLLSVINDVLDIARMDAEKLSLRDESIRCDKLCREVLETIADTAAANRTTYGFRVADEAEVVFADRVRLKQCLMNLLSNAAKFTQGGRIDLHVYEAELKGTPAIAFDVADTGIGIAPTAQSGLFLPFVQNDSFHHKQQGSGLGLSITRRLARAMGGDVTFESEPGRGSTFTLLLPRARIDELETEHALGAAA